MAKKEELSLEKFKKGYEPFRKKYSLPEYGKLNEDFNIERVADIETDFLLREIRKFMAERISNYLRFIEALLHPVNVPMFVFSIVKVLTKEDKDSLGDVYKKLARIEIKLIELDLKYSELREAEFINHSYKMWQSIKDLVLEVFDSVDGKLDTKFKGNSKGYLG